MACANHSECVVRPRRQHLEKTASIISRELPLDLADNAVANMDKIGPGSPSDDSNIADQAPQVFSFVS